MARLLLLLAALVVCGAAIICPSGYTLHSDKCYKLYTTYKTRSQAALQCQLDGAILPTIPDADTNGFLFNYARQVGSIFLGLTCASDQVSGCRFDDLNSLKTATYQNFYADRPVIKFGNCVWMEENGLYHGEWASVDCDNTTSAFVCQYYDGTNCSNNQITTTPTPATSTSINGGPNWPGYCNFGDVLYTPITIFTPNYPSPYIWNYACLWHIHSPRGGAVNITITDLQIDGGTRIGIYAENDFNIPIAVINSTQSTPISFRDAFYNPTIVFETADYTPYRGFKATITDAFSGPVVVRTERRTL